MIFLMARHTFSIIKNLTNKNSNQDKLIGVQLDSNSGGPAKPRNTGLKYSESK